MYRSKNHIIGVKTYILTINVRPVVAQRIRLARAGTSLHHCTLHALQNNKMAEEIERVAIFPRFPVYIAVMLYPKTINLVLKMLLR